MSRISSSAVHLIFLLQNIYFEAVGCAMLLLTSVYQFWRGAYRVGGREEKGHISTIIRINFIILFFTGLLNLTYPSWVISFKVRSILF